MDQVDITYGPSRYNTMDQADTMDQTDITIWTKQI